MSSPELHPCHTSTTDLSIYILDRSSAYNYWVLKLADDNGLYAPNLPATTVIVKAGYLMRNATMSGSTLNLIGDFNATTDIEIIGGLSLTMQPSSYWKHRRDWM